MVKNEFLIFSTGSRIINLNQQPFSSLLEVLMIIVHVHVHVKPESIEAFKQASIENARNSIQEPGIAHFDLIQQIDDPTRFILVEIYRTAEAQGAHKETKHYARWRDTVADMMAEPRSAVKYVPIFPDESGY
jgi:(4S)-4-hydroxy-5-phosphonooxypentane-2,3-dione isomerase